jgi:molybdate transport system substrate-binding protein
MAAGMWKRACLALLLLLGSCAPSPVAGPVVLAASSMTEALDEAADQWAAQGHKRPVLSFASSATLARQASEGAPADIVITADAEWMDWMASEGLLRAGARRDIAGNRLVLVTGGDPRLTRHRRFDDPAEPLRALDGRLAIAEPQSVPAGRYAMAAISALGLREQVTDKLVPAENVRAALALVERGEAELGIVYASDAQASGQVLVLAEFASDLHPRIVYSLALLARSDNAEAAGFAAYLASAAGQAVLRRHGFTASE